VLVLDRSSNDAFTNRNEHVTHVSPYSRIDQRSVKVEYHRNRRGPHDIDELCVAAVVRTGISEEEIEFQWKPQTSHDSDAAIISTYLPMFVNDAPHLCGAANRGSTRLGSCCALGGSRATIDAVQDLVVFGAGAAKEN